MPPPMVLRNKEIWMQVTNTMTSKKINFTEANAIRDGIHIQPATTVDHWKRTSLFDGVTIQYNTYLLPKEKPINVVIPS